MFRKIFDSRCPLDEASTLPTEYYLSEKQFYKELELLRQTWQYVGSIDQLSDGDFFTIDIANEPILVTKRNEDGYTKMAALSNVCRHKGTTLVNEPCGSARNFRCPYHGWTYDNKGKLLGCPEFEGVKNFEKEENGLREFTVACLNNFIFISLNGREGGEFQKYAKFLQNTMPVTRHLQFSERREYDVNCNWKIFVDNYLDGGYHVPHAHKNLAELVDYPNYVTDVYDNCVVQSSPLERENTVRSGLAYYGWLFPNFMVNIYDDYMDVNLVLPISIDKCKVIFDFYFSEKFLNPQKKYKEDSINVAEKIQREDIEICERVQRGIKSKYYVNGRLSAKREAGIYKFHKMIFDLS